MTGKFFIDTNILVYSVDKTDSGKQTTARKLLENLAESDNAVISTQVLQEFYYTVTRKKICGKEDAQSLVEYFSAAFPIFNNTVNEIISAIKTSIKTQFSFWDSLIISAAKSAGCTAVYSEDLNDGQIVDGVKIVNPFK